MKILYAILKWKKKLNEGEKMKKLKEYIMRFIQGFCMAMADSVPGVSGGSIAFLMGFYNEFITSLIFYRGRGRKSRWHDNCHG